MADNETTRDLDASIGSLRFAMITTESPNGLEGRPVTLIEHDAGSLHFLVSKDSDWVGAIGASGAQIGVTFSDGDESLYVSLRGTGRVVEDQAEIDRLWNPAASAYFEGRDDPAVVALVVEVAAGEWWDSPSSRIGQAIAMVKAAVTNDPGAAGDKGSVDPT